LTPCPPGPRVLNINSLAVCSDANIGKRRAGEDDNTDIFTYDLAFPASTSSREIALQFQAIKSKVPENPMSPQMTVVFSTYQSIEAVSKAQEIGLPEFT
jgi:predicted helicase